MSRLPHKTKKRPRSPIINPNNNLATFPMNDFENASVFYGVSMSWKTFCLYLLRTDDAFARDVVQFLRMEEDSEFRDYDRNDVIDDCLETWGLENFTRTRPIKSENAQCADTLEDMMFHVQRIVAVNCDESFRECSRDAKHPDPSISVTAFPDMEIEYHPPDDNSDTGAMVFIGKRAFVYRDGKPCHPLPDVVAQVGTRLGGAIAALSLNGPRFL